MASFLPCAALPRAAQTRYDAVRVPADTVPSY